MGRSPCGSHRTEAREGPIAWRVALDLRFILATIKSGLLKMIFRGIKHLIKE